MTPLGVLIFTNLRSAIIAMLFFIIGILVTTIFEPHIGPHLYASDAAIKFQYSMNITVSLNVNFITSAWFVYRIKMEKKRSEELLLNILHTDVANELKKYGKV